MGVAEDRVAEARRFADSAEGNPEAVVLGFAVTALAQAVIESARLIAAAILVAAPHAIGGSDQTRRRIDNVLSVLP